MEIEVKKTVNVPNAATRAAYGKGGRDMSVSILCIASTIVGIVLGFVLGRCG